MATMQKLRAYQGPALFSYGFRPFFLFGAIYAGVMVPLWLAVFAGDVSLRTAFAPRDWHVHEMLFGYIGAVIAGFLLTAVPNWTGRLPIQGTPLAVLFAGPPQLVVADCLEPLPRGRLALAPRRQDVAGEEVVHLRGRPCVGMHAVGDRADRHVVDRHLGPQPLEHRPACLAVQLRDISRKNQTFV